MAAGFFGLLELLGLWLTRDTTPATVAFVAADPDHTAVLDAENVTDLLPAEDVTQLLPAEVVTTIVRAPKT